jgi:hypothetical protein
MRGEVVDAEGQAGESLPAELEGYRAQFEAIKRDASELVAGLSDAQFNWRPAPGVWSIAECLAHLNVTGQYFLPRIDRRLREARAAGMLSEGPFRYGLLSRVMVRGSEPPAKLKFKAPKIFQPMSEHLSAVIVPAFMTLQDQLVERLRAARGVDLRRVKVTSPVSSLVKISLGQVFPFVAAHERRHLWQARRVREDANFPVA